MSAGLAAALRQRLEALLPAGLGTLATALHAARDALRRRFPEPADRRRALSDGLAAGGSLDILGADHDVASWLAENARPGSGSGDIVAFRLASADPDDLTLRQARQLANADRVCHAADVPTAILDRARADAARIECAAPPVDPASGITIWVEMA